MTDKTFILYYAHTAQIISEILYKIFYIVMQFYLKSYSDCLISFSTVYIDVHGYTLNNISLIFKN